MLGKSIVARFVLLLCITALVLVGCSNNAGNSAVKAPSKSSTDTPATKEDTAPFKISFMSQSILAEPPKEKDPIIMAIEKHTNTDLDIQWIPDSSFKEKVNASIASGDLPMVLQVNDKPELIVSAAREGQFWEVGPYLKDYPNLEKAMNPNVIKSLLIDGKLYSLLRSRSLVGDGLIWRQDWMDNLGIKTPTTMDEVYEMVKAFTFDDPDGNGKDDTIGMTEEKSIRGYKFVMAQMGGANQWEDIDGKLVPAEFSQAHIDTLNWYKRMFDEGLLNKDFAVTERTQNIDFINKGLYGFRMGDNDFIVRHTELFKITPSAVLATTSKIDGVNGNKVLMDNGFSGHFMIPKQSVKTEEDLKKILAYFDKLSEPAGQDIFQWGVEGLHYDLVDGKPKRTDAQSDKYSKEVIAIQQALQVSDGSLAMDGELDENVKKYKDAKAEMSDNLVLNPAASYISDTFVLNSSELKKIILDGNVKYIMGKIGDYQPILDSWLAAGGDKVIEEMNEAYKNDPARK